MVTKQSKPAAAQDIPASIGTTLTQRSRFRQWLHDWQELIVWKPILVAVLLALFYALPRLDPRSGIDGFGDTFAIVLRLIALAVLWFATWLIKRTYFTEIHEDEERALLDRLSARERVVLDRLEWLAIVCIALFVLTR